MPFSYVDLLGMKPTEMLDAPIADTPAAIKTLLDSATTAEPLALAGMRHSQGGHTAATNGRMVITETMGKVLSVDACNQTVTVQGGATWSQVHHALRAYGLAPLVHQSSAHFSVGGSIAVNCHGRDLVSGPLANTVVSLKVLTGTGDTLTASRTENEQLFQATIGGYGACGAILKATLKVTPNLMMQRIWTPMTLDKYAKHLGELLAGTYPTTLMHHGWINVSKGGYFSEVISYDVKREDPPLGDTWAVDNQLQAEGWGNNEILRAGWAAARRNGDIRSEVWKHLSDRGQRGTPSQSRLNWLREDISFTMSAKTDLGVDMLQEYFVPLDQFKSFVEALATIFPYVHPPGGQTAQLLSSTVRLVMPEQAPVSYLSYAVGSPRVAVAIDAYVPLTAKGEPTCEAAKQFRRAISLAWSKGGSYYLPYYSFACPEEHFQPAYPQHGDWKSAALRYNPKRKFWNNFLAKYGV